MIQLGVEVEIVATDSMGYRSVLDAPAGAADVPLRVFPTTGGDRFALSWSLMRYLMETASVADVIHVHSLYQFPQMSAFVVATLQHIPLVVSPRGALDHHLRTRGAKRKAVMERVWQRRMFDRAACIHYTSNEELEQAQDRQYGGPVAVIPNGISLDGFRRDRFDAIGRQEVRNAWNIPENAPIIVNHGRLHEKKGLKFLIAALPLIRESFPDARLVLIANSKDPEYRPLKAQVEAIGMQQNVLFAGELTGGRLIDLLRASDVWALPSFTENFGNAVLEALALGLPLVTTREVAVASDAARSGACLLGERSPASMAKEIVKILKDPELARQLETNGPQFAQLYEWDRLAYDYLDMYENAAEQRMRGCGRVK
jgi:glycosyltransferase involved in cell wall biosynthesis